ncbi:hypothetical protein KKF91_19245 [Myxococcota bacterium]|nr:hypothetical protein [Myxococcota bacterium]
MRFDPIAIIGRACVLPGADSPRALWAALIDGADLIGEAPPDRWRVDPARLSGPDPVAHARGGYVFDFQPNLSGLKIPEATLTGLDPLFQLAIHAARAALEDAGQPRGAAGAILGNLSFPSSAMSRFAEAVWRGDPTPDPRDRFMSGLPALLLREALGLQGPTFALDAACASGLYAIRYACDALHRGEAEVMLGGAVNRADDLFIHMGFTALNAMSPSGRSRPFDAEADGLIPAEGAAFVVLKRLADARRDGDTIHGVIRAVGLSNDGRDGGLLAPSKAGQIRAMRAAYAESGLDPKEIAYLECHATGTPVGDAVEIESAAVVFEGHEGLKIGSLKGNMGHLITAAGVAGLIKVIEGLRHQHYPPSRPPDAPHPALAGRPLSVMGAATPWSGPRRAAVSAFGFGGNNAHLIVEADHPEIPLPKSPLSAALAPGADEIVIVGLAARTGAPLEAITLPWDLRGAPPKDLEVALPQQLALLSAALEATAGLDLSPSRAGTFVAMLTDPEVCRYGLRWRSPAALGDQIIAPLGAAGVLGTMPNIIANRLNSQLDLQGGSCVISAEARGGLEALRLGVAALRAGALDLALIGAVEMGYNPVHAAALAALIPHAAPDDAAVVLALRRRADAEALGAPIYGALSFEGTSAPLAPRAGVYGHAARALLEIIEALKGDEAGYIEVIDQLQGRDGVWVQPIKRPPTPPSPQGRVTPAHWPPPDPFPPPPRADHAAPWRPAGPSSMPPAPRLAPIMAVEPEITPPTPEITPPTPEITPPTPEITPPTPEIEGVMGRWGAYSAQLAALQGAFTAQSEALHAQFLATQARSVAALLIYAQNQAAAPLICAQNQAAAPPPEAPKREIRRARGPMRPSAPQITHHTPVIAHPTITQAAVKSEENSQASPKEITGPVFDRAALEIHASGAISTIFGPLFEGQDGYTRQVRMPEPPLLLADRVIGLDATPGSMGKGTIWTETDVGSQGWYLNEGRMPAGVMIESGQADLMLISYLGIDALNRGARVYRLLACELTYAGQLPRPGETLRYDIHVDGHARHGDVRLFFFHYDCRVGDEIRLKVRQGQAGFFTDQELADSAGVIWSPEAAGFTPGARQDPPEGPPPPARLDDAQLEALSEGAIWRAFGPGWDRCQTHTATPKIQGGPMRFLREIVALDHQGGPAGRGYLRADSPITPEDWYFKGHFKNDPCMPGTLMFEGCLQAMSVYLISLGYTRQRDGWRFEPVSEETYHLICRGQATPSARQITYEVFVDEIIAGPLPTLYADILCTIDGLKAFYTRRMGLRLVPDWPLARRPELLDGVLDPRAVALEGLRFDYAAMLASAWGPPSHAFPGFERFDGARRVARLPGPPYHFMSRVIHVEGGAPGALRVGTTIELAYDIPPDAWYFRENGAATMPFCVLLEAALQPCGWLANFVGSPLTVDTDLSFRNLDGEGTLKAEILPSAETLRTRVTLTSLSRSAGMIIEGFKVRCFIGAEEVYTLETVFGYFPKAALENQVGLSTSEAQRAKLTTPSTLSVDLRAPSPRRGPRLAAPMLRMIDRVTGYWPEGGPAGLGVARAEKDVEAGAWFFKAHFFQDPVQPGSLGLEALLQLLQWVMLTQIDEAVEGHFEPIALGEALRWRYRGQVLPEDGVITTTLALTRLVRDEAGLTAWADGDLWIDGKRIYEAEGLAMRAILPARSLNR